MVKDKIKITRLSLTEKNANNKAWFKKRADELKGMAFTSTATVNEISEWKRKKVNYDLYNGIINLRDFEYVCKPFGAEMGELPASFTNKDIVSARIKTLLGMESKRPFPWGVAAVNEEATTRKEEETFGRVRDYVVQQTLAPIKQQIEIKYQQELQGKELNKDEQAKIQKQIADELEAQTPEETKKYMERKHQDPAEALAHQLLQALSQKLNLKYKFNKLWKHGLLSGEEVSWVGETNGHPDTVVTNSLRFDYDKSPDCDFIENGEWAVAEYRMTPSQCVSYFGSELEDHVIDELFGDGIKGAQIYDADWNFDDNIEQGANTIGVYHCTWKDLTRLGYLYYNDPNTGQTEMKVVDETYTLNKEAGDIKIEWDWYPETYETYIIGNDTYVRERPIPGQFKDLNNLYNCKLPYYGAAFDNLNSETTSLMDRMKVWQYYYNIIMYRIELLMASDKGKLMLMNINAIPKSSGIDIEKWMYYAEALKIGWVNPNEEGNKGLDVTNMAKEIDMSLMSDIQKYIELATYIEEQCGRSVGLGDNMIGQIPERDAVGNTKQNVAQNIHILEPYFALHNQVKRNILQALIEQAKVSYADADGETLSYFLDDLSIQTLKIDAGLLDASTLGVYVMDSTNAHEALELVKQMAHAAMQAQTIDLSDVMKVVRTTGIQEAEEQLVVSEKIKREQVERSQVAAIEAQGKEDEKEREFKREEWAFERETELKLQDKKNEGILAKQAMLSVGFNEDKDMDDDGQLDVIEIYKKGKEVDIKSKKQTLDERKFEEEKKQNKIKNKQEDKKLSKPGSTSK